MKFFYKNSFLILFLILLFTQFAHQTTSAQQGVLFQSNQMRLGSGVVRIAEPGEIADSINVWGDVQNSGRFMVPRGTSLAKMISYAGGPVLFRTGDTVIDWSVVKLEISITKTDSSSKKAPFKRIVFSYAESVPSIFNEIYLDNNDIVILQVKRERNWRDFLQVIGPIASTITAVLTTYFLVKNSF